MYVDKFIIFHHTENKILICKQKVFARIHLDLTNYIINLMIYIFYFGNICLQKLLIFLTE